MAILWAWLAPWLAPAVLKVLPWLGWFRGLPAALRVGSYITVAGAAAFAVYWFLSDAKSKEPTPLSVGQAIDLSRAQSENDSLKRSIAFRDALDTIIDTAEFDSAQQLAQLRLEMEKARAAVQNADNACFAGDSLRWLLDKRRH